RALHRGRPGGGAGGCGAHGEILSRPRPLASWDIDTTGAIELGIAIEEAGRAHAGISNSDGASVQAGQGLSVYANSHGFVGRERGTNHSLSLALIAGGEDGMQRDYWYDSVRAAGDFISA